MEEAATTMVHTRGATAAIRKLEQDAQQKKLGKKDFEILECIGKGGQGCVHRAKHKESGVVVALKCIPHNENWYGDEDEADVHSQLNHPNILRMHGTFEEMQSTQCDGAPAATTGQTSTKNLQSASPKPSWTSEDEDKHVSATWLILEYCPEGTIMDALSKKRFSDTKSKESFVGKAVCDILRAMECMQGKKILHRDVKPANILFKDGIAKMADLGIATKFDASDRIFPTGTTGCMAPEVLSMARKLELRETKWLDCEDELGYWCGADFWSLGVVICAMLANGLHPFPIPVSKPDFTEEMRLHLGNACFSHEGIHFPDYVSDEAKQFIVSLLQVNPEKRLCSVDKALKHPWIVPHAKCCATMNDLATNDKENIQVNSRVNKQVKRDAISKRDDDSDDCSSACSSLSTNSSHSFAFLKLKTDS